MINNVVNFPQLPDGTQVKPVSAKPEVAAPSTGDPPQNSSSGSSQPDDAGTAAAGGPKSPTPYYELRLTIDKDPQTGGWVYKAIDRNTGKVVSQLPQQSVMEMQKSEEYQAGSIINSEI